MLKPFNGQFCNLSRTHSRRESSPRLFLGYTLSPVLSIPTEADLLQCLAGAATRCVTTKGRTVVANAIPKGISAESRHSSGIRSPPTSLSLIDHRIGFDLDKPFWVHEAVDSHDRVDGADFSKILLAHVNRSFPICDVSQDDTGSDDMMQA